MISKKNNIYRDLVRPIYCEECAWRVNNHTSPKTHVYCSYNGCAQIKCGYCYHAYHVVDEDFYNVDNDIEPEFVNAIPVEWILNYISTFSENEERQRYLRWMLDKWTEEKKRAEDEESE